jgi:hypothetical protein
MKYLKTFEKFGDWFRKKKKEIIEPLKIEDESLKFPTGEICHQYDLPNEGDYVVLNTKYDEQNGFSHPDRFKDKIGVIVNKTGIWNPEHTGMLVTIFYENDNKINEDEDTYTQELECWSKSKKEVENYLNSKKYNL